MSMESWQARHQVLTAFLWLEVPVLLVVGVFGPMSLAEGLLLPLVVAGFGIVAGFVQAPQIKANVTSVGLIGGSFIGIELSGGQSNSHLFILSALALVALYQQWSPLILTVGAVVGHHLAFGLLAPSRVMAMGHGMTADPTVGAVVMMVITHAAAVIVEVVAILLWWHFAESAEREADQLRAQMDAERHEAQARRDEASVSQAATDRDRAEDATRRGEAIAQDAVRIRDRSRDAVEAVAALEQQSVMMGAAVHEIAQRCQEAAATANTGQQTTGAAALEVRRLEEAMSEIAEVNKMIGQLAAQTNLLSLNATIEAARAGEMGKGFGVVAQEVKALANATAASAAKVRAVVDGVVGETEKVAQSFRTTNDLVGLIGGAQTDIAASVEEQASVLAEVSRQTAVAAAAGREVTAALEAMIANSVHG
jgi:methyl-accepting chemotaxis protein